MGDQPGLKQQKNSEFLHKLAQILDDQLNWKIIRYDEKRHKLIIPNKAKLETLLPLYFKHSRYQSFSRQLNWFGFEKLRGGPYHVYENEALKNGKQLHKLVSKRKQVYQASKKRKTQKRAQEENQNSHLRQQNANNNEQQENLLNSSVNNFYFLCLPPAYDMNCQIMVQPLHYPFVWN